MDNPDIYEYADFRKYLSDWQTVRQTQDPVFTKTHVSHLLGLPRTRGYFSDILGGKRVSDTFLERFVDILDLSRERTRFFRTLVRFNQAETPEEKDLALDQLVSLNHAPVTRLENRAWEYYRSWRHGAVRALLSVHDLDSDSLVRAAAHMTPPLTPGQALQSLELLTELGLVLQDERGFWKPAQATLATPEYAKDEVLRLLQIQQLDLVRKALLEPGDGSRAVATNLVTVSESAWSQIRDRLDKFRSEVRAIAHRDPDPADRVILIASALLPLHEVTK